MEEKKAKLKVGTKMLILFISLILIAGIIIACFNFYEPSFNKTNIMTEEEIKTLVKNGATYENYSYHNRYTKIEKIKDGEITQVNNYIKGNKMLQEVQRQNAETTYNWFDFDTKEVVVTSYTNKKILDITRKEELELSLSIRQNATELDSFDGIKYLGETKIEDRTQIVVKVWNKNAAYYHFLYYIDKESGLITKVEYSILGIYKQVLEKNIEYNTVTEEQVAKPDLTKFTNYTIQKTEE